MKTGLFISAVFIFLVGLFAASTGQAVTFECINSTQLIEITQKGDECPLCDSCCTKCPPVKSCPTGESCQPDINPGEKQKYPPAAAATWVASLGCADLTDVALDDQRWGNREEGEVYAQQGDGCLSLYWPSGGDALFDISSAVTNPARWNDYRLAGGQSGGGDYTVANGKERIYFGDSGGGMTVFTSEDESPPRGFLDNYINPEQAKVPADGLYPFGQRMWLSMYSNNRIQLTKMHNAGMTLSGPHYHGCSEYDYPPNIAETNNYGMKMYWRLYIGGGGWSGILSKMKTSEGRTYLGNRVRGCINAVTSDTVRNNIIVAWYGHQEEPFERSGLPIAEQRAYLKFVRDIIIANDPKKRPYFVSERTDSGESNMTGNAVYTAGIMKQNYLMRSNAYDYQGQEMNERFIIGQWVRDQLHAAKNSGQSYTGKTKPVVATLSMYTDPKDSTLHNETWLRKAITHDFWLSIAMGAHGVNVYSFAGSSAPKTGAMQQGIYLDVMGKFSKSGLQHVFLWGDPRTDVDMQIISGPKIFTWNKYSKTYTEPSIKFRNIQYGDNRYILLVNSAKEAVTVRLSGIPADLKVVDIITGGGIKATIQSLGVRMYKVSK